MGSIWLYVDNTVRLNRGSLLYQAYDQEHEEDNTRSSKAEDTAFWDVVVFWFLLHFVRLPS